ncbi:uncharacterized protein LOC122256023 [Penaeus japonicus]|uniref:uncharacterized protein LOC122256023 n=1 Tax=Penaeus japonicus TaxID=27405 RepID=UPI001C70D161|nr:uncharacterized protein LOC122256023 [Penaeus japonicus]
MEILTLSGGRSLHEEAPMDLSTSTSRLRHHPLPIMLSHHAPWTSLGAERGPRYFIEPVPKLPEEPVAARSPPSSSSMSRCIPIPKKRHCMARASPPSPAAGSPAAHRYSPPSLTDYSTFSSSPEVARKRARLESPEPSDARRDSRGFRREEVAGGVISSSSGGGGIRVAGAGPTRSNGDVGATGEGITQSAMWPQQSRQVPADVGGGSPSSGSPLGEERLEEPNQLLLNTLMQLQNTPFSPGQAPPPAALKDTDALLSAIHQSQMLYYSYCSQLIQTLRNKQVQQEQQKKRHEERQTRLEHETVLLKRQSSSSSSSHDDFQTHVEECEDADEDDEYLDVTDEDHMSDINSILRTRLNPQEALTPFDHQSSCAGSPSSALPSSTTGLDDPEDVSPSDAAGGARKRAPRALTGKHVRPGTGASATTLLTLRQKLEERQKFREVHGAVPTPQPPQRSKARPKKK